MICDFARPLDEADIKTIESLEQELGLLIVAFACRSFEPAREERLRKAMEAMGPLLQAEPAEPDEGQLGRIRQAEKAMGLSLVAVRR